MPEQDDQMLTGGTGNRHQDEEETLTRRIGTGEESPTLTGGMGNILQEEEETLTGGMERTFRDTRTLPGDGKTGESGLIFTRTFGVGTGELVDKIYWEVGDVIDGRYEVMEVIGRGGMGIVYRVYHREWHLDLAVKMPLAHLVADEKSRARFIREAQIWVDLGLHPNIVQCWYVRELGGVPRVFMDYLRGGSLKSWIMTGKVKPGEWDKILDLVIQACDGLGYAYERGVKAHRDVKPGNMLLTEDRELRVADFGTVKYEISAEVDRRTAGKSSSGKAVIERTKTGITLGTPEYGAPEQWERSMYIDARADIYALGVVLFELCCGRRPFDDGIHREPPHVLIGRHLVSPAPDPMAFNSNVPGALAEIIMKCLSKEPEKRPESMSLFRKLLTGVYQETVGKNYRRVVPRAAELRPDALNNRAVSLLDLGRKKEAYDIWRKALKLDVYHPESVYNKALLEWVESRITDDEVVRRLEEIKHANGRASLYLGLIHLERAAADNAEDELAHTVKEPDLAINSRVWRFLGDIRMAQQKYIKADEAYQKVLELIPGEPREQDSQRLVQMKICQRDGRPMFCWQRGFRSFGGGHKEDVTTVAVTPDGGFIVSGSKDKSLRLWNLMTREYLRTFTGHEEGVLSVAVSPDGQFAVSGSQDKTLRLWNLKTGRGLWVARGHTGEVTAVTITPDGRFVVSGSRDKTLRLWNIETGRCLWISEKHSSQVNAITVTPDERWILSGHDDEDLYLWDLATGKHVERSYYGAPLDLLGFTSSSVSDLAVMPDGQYTVTARKNAMLNLWELETGQILQNFKGHAKNVTAVAITPDGRFIVSGSADKTLRLWDPATTKCLQTFEGHEKGITSLAITPNGRFVVSGSQDTTLRLWDIETRRCLWTFWGEQAYQESVSSLAVSPDGRFIVSGNQDSTLRQWDLITTKCLQTFERYRKEMTAVALTPDGRFIVSGSDDSTVWLWDFKTAEYVRIFEGHTKDVTWVAVTPDGRFIVSGSLDRTLQLWELTTGRCFRIFKGHKEGVTAGVVTPDGQFIVSGSLDGTLRLWDLETAKCLRTFKGHQEGVTAVTVTPNGKLLISGGDDSTLRLWELTTAKCLRSFRGHTGKVAAVAVTPDGCFAVSGGFDKTLRIWELATARCLRTFKRHVEGITAVAVTPNGYFAVSGSEDKTMRLWSLDFGSPRYKAAIQVCRQRSLQEIQLSARRFQQRINWAKTAWQSGKPVAAYKYLIQARAVSGYEHAPEALTFNATIGTVLARKRLRGEWWLWTLKGHDERVTTVAITPDGQFIVSGSQDKTLRLWDRATAKCLRIFKGHTGGISSVSISPDGRFVVSGSGDKTLRLWDLLTARCLRIYKGHTLSVTTATFTHYGRFIISGSQDRTLRMWNPATTECLQVFKGHEHGVTAAAVSPDRRFVVSGCEGRTMCLWDRATARCLLTFEGHRRGVLTTKIAPNGQFFISGSKDKTLRFWELSSGKCVRSFEGHENWVTSGLITPDARFVLSGSRDKTLRLWDLFSGKCVWIFEEHGLGVTTMAMTPDARFVISGSEDKSLKVWELDWELDVGEKAVQIGHDSKSSGVIHHIASLLDSKK